MPVKKSFSIPVPALFSFDECAWFLHRNFDDCMHKVVDGKVYKALEYDGNILLFSIEGRKEHIYIKSLLDGWSTDTIQFIRRYIVEWFDLDRDIQVFYSLLASQPPFQQMTEDYLGLRLIGINDLFEALAWSIIGQQINLKFAYTLKRRLVEKLGKSVQWQQHMFYIFPQPSAILTADDQWLREIQLSSKKIEYLKIVAAAFIDGTLSKEELKSLPTSEARHRHLIRLKGIGKWTANYALMKSIKDLNVIPHGDIGIYQALENFGMLANRKDQAQIENIFANFDGWEAYFVLYLWRSLVNK